MPSTEPLRQLLGLSGPRDAEPSVEHIVERIVDDLIDLALENARLTGELQRARRDAEDHTSEGAAPGSSEETALRDEPRCALSDHQDLQLRPALSALEQVYIRSAMARTRGNQTAAARLLGLSRFGLQKKLRRLADGGDEPAMSPR
jgi:DNA-binding protein Fis